VGILCGSALGLSLVIRKARESQQPEEYFSAFLSLFLLLFTASGIANGSTFKQMSQVFRVCVCVWVGGWCVIYVYIYVFRAHVYIYIRTCICGYRCSAHKTRRIYWVLCWDGRQQWRPSAPLSSPRCSRWRQRSARWPKLCSASQPTTSSASCSTSPFIFALIARGKGASSPSPASTIASCPSLSRYPSSCRKTHSKPYMNPT
jgi:hypothetical protein